MALSAGNDVSVLNAATSAAEKISISLIELRRRPRELSDGHVIAVFSRLRRLHTRIPLFTRPITSHSREKKKGESQAHKASELNHNLICLWYKWALTYYLIMGFSAKPPSIAALQSTCLRRSADPTLGPPRDPGSCDLSGLLELMISQEGRRWEERGEGATTGSCQQSSLSARDLGQQPWTDACL